ncbi:HEPN domain-containing protein [Methylobacterium cerastii]|nr:HEPN domain-containing protein [Methylobacterium cerastii]
MRKLQVIYGVILAWQTIDVLLPLNDVVPKQDRLPVPLSAMIDERPVSDFAADRIGRLLSDLGTFQDMAIPIPEQLVGLVPFADPAPIARRIVDEFASLPWDYVFSLRLPRSIGTVLATLMDGVGPMEIGGGISLVRTGDALQEQFPLPYASNLLMALGAKGAWETDAVYLQVPGSGYADRYGTTGTVLRAVETLQTFLGLGIALHLFRYNPSSNSTPFGPPRSSYHVHRHVAGAWVHDASVDMEATVVMGLEGFDCTGLAGSQSYVGFVGAVLQTMKSCFSLPSEAGRILRAAQWLAGSYASRNETLAFVQAMVAMEILLGDKKTSDMVGIGELLSNRCAYLIGESQADREAVLAEFRGLYKVRSEIVHSGKTRLSYSEREKFQMLRSICQRSIAAEIELLRKNQAG